MKNGRFSDAQIMAVLKQAQRAHLTFERFDPIPFLGRHAVAHATVLLSLFDPSAQGLERVGPDRIRD